MPEQFFQRLYMWFWSKKFHFWKNFDASFIAVERASAENKTKMEKSKSESRWMYISHENIFVCIHVHVCVWAWERVCVCERVKRYTFMYARVHFHRHSSISLALSVCAFCLPLLALSLSLREPVWVHVHVHVHVYMCMCIHVCVCSCVSIGVFLRASVWGLPKHIFHKISCNMSGCNTFKPTLRPPPPFLPAHDCCSSHDVKNEKHCQKSCSAAHLSLIACCISRHQCVAEVERSCNATTHN